MQCRPERAAERVEAGWDGALRSGRPHAQPSRWSGEAAEKTAVWDRKQLNGTNKIKVQRKVVRAVVKGSRGQNVALCVVY